ncbi:Pyruvate:ferredoxin oxidoreductase, alpha subunit / Pyruvate:ferredoxin oxidoreductase, beta subunit [hydrothermal vent metagenome]|uniref:Pyruvate:ferredoxin oxidoreductase, alpha subunit / Pyruvate:ferredoxin oxidoreductase, beta subunit n=1 Tax=hydrothermal vent metagenome TaxID=652676 RepID=A0A3B1C161_9ZZZZ
MSSKTETKETASTGSAVQVTGFKSGNEMSSLAASHINFHVMGYYPITPSTEVAEYLDEMGANGEHGVKMIPGDGEHGAAGTCYGATTAGGRVFNATSANGLLYSLEQYPVQSGTRYPMVLNLVCRSVSGPLDIRGDHSDLISTLDMGWIILCAKDPQAVYDMIILAVKIGECEDVRLPVIVADDGFFTSHQKRRVKYFEEGKPVQDFVGKFQVHNSSVDIENPVTIGPYMNDPDQINNKKQLSMAMEAAESVIPKIYDEWEKLTGRKYKVLETYKMDDADTAIFILNSAADTTMVVVDKLRAEGKKVGMIYPTVIRPFPSEQVREACKNIKALVVADRADSYGGHGGRMSHEIKAALKDDPDNKTMVISRIYGLGGKDFFDADAIEMFELTFDAVKKGKVEVLYDYIGITPGDPDWKPVKGRPPLTKKEQSPGIIKVTKNDKTGMLDVKGVKQRDLTAMPQRIVPGHGACPGCGIFPSIGTFLKGIEGFVVMLWHTGCGMVVTTGYPNTSFAITYIHNLFQNGAATLSGVVEMYKERQRRGEIAVDQDITFVMVTGDGGLDIGLGPALGAAFRSHNMIVLEYDNQGYMNTGNQLSFTTPLGHATSTSNVGSIGRGKTFHHKDTAQLFASCHIPYVFTGAESMYKDLIKKAAKAQWYAKHEGMVFGKLYSDCPLNWRHPDHNGQEIIQAGIDCNFFPLYEVERGITTLNYDPETKGKKVPVTKWLEYTGKTKHLLKEENRYLVDKLQAEVDRRFSRIKAMSEHPDL